MSKSRKVLLLILSIVVLGGVAFATTQSSWLKGDIGGEPDLGDDDALGDIDIPIFETADGGLGGTGVDTPIGDDDDDDLDPNGPIDGLPPGGFTPGGGGGTTEPETYAISLSVMDLNGDGISGLTSSNITSSDGTIEEIVEGSSGSYTLSMSSSGTFTIEVTEDGYITTSEDAETWGSQDDTKTGYLIEMPYSHVVTVVDENGASITGATVKVGSSIGTGKDGGDSGKGTFGSGGFSTEASYWGGTSQYKTCENYESNKYGCANLASSTKHQYSVSKSGYDSVRGTFSTAYTASRTSSVTVSVTLEVSDSDADNDGLLTSEEETLGTDPNNSDTDGDGLDDYEEFVTYKTDPNDTDTDDGSVEDGVEILTNGTDPNNATDDVAVAVEAVDETTSFSCSSVTISSSNSELDANVSKDDINLTVTVSFDTEIAAVWQKSLFAMVTLASIETWTDQLVLKSDGNGEFKEDSSGNTDQPIYVDISTDDGTNIEVDFTYIDAEDDDVISAYIEGDKGCKDKLTVTQAASSSDDDDDDDDDTTTNVTVDETYTTTLDTILLSESYNCEDTFTDTTGDYEEIICRMYNAEVVEGYDPPYIFDTSGDVTNAEAIKMIVGLLLEKDKSDASGLTEGFTDVSSSAWYSDWVKIAEDEDIVRTRDFGGYFFPNSPCSRGQLAVYVARALGLTTYNYTVDFTDVDHDDYDAYAIALLSDEDQTVDVPYDDSNDEFSVIEGYSNNTFRPDNDISRAEALTMIYRAWLIHMN